MFKPGHVNRVSQFLIEIHFDAYLCWLLTLHNLCRIIYRREHSFPPLLKWLGLTGLQEALQLYWADELLPVVRPAGNDAQQLLGYNNTQRVWQVGLVNSGDEEWAAWLHTQKKGTVSVSEALKIYSFYWWCCFRIRILHRHHISAAIARRHLGHEGIYRTDLELSVHENRK